MKTQGMIHQLAALEKSDGMYEFGYLFEQGCGKSWATMADAERAWERNEIEGLLIAAPKGVHTNWTRREIPTHMSIPHKCYTWRGNPTSKKAKAAWQDFISNKSSMRVLRVFAINIDAFNTPAGRAHVDEFLAAVGESMFAVDESTRIKNPSAKRVEHLLECRKPSKYRRILTGTPVTKGPLDLYSQFHFLRAGLLGTKSYRSFVSEYAVLVPADSPQMRAIMAKTKSRFVPQVVAVNEQGEPQYKNLERLIGLMEPYIYRVRKEDCLDLPPKVRQTIYFELTPAQSKVYDRLLEENEFATDLECHEFQAIATRTKLKQVTSGFVNIKGELVYMEGGENPRAAALEEALDTIDSGVKMIIWAVYKEEIQQVQAILEKRGLSFVTYTGATSADGREAAVDRFQAGEVDVFVANAQAAGIGLTLTAAEEVIYYTCNYDLELRLQSEDRVHRIGQKKTVRYTDLVAENTIDEDVMRSLSRKSNIANQIVDGGAK